MALEAENGANSTTSRAAESMPTILVVMELGDSIGQSHQVARLDEMTGLSVDDGISYPDDVVSDDRDLSRHGVEYAVGKPFVERSRQINVDIAIEIGRLRHPPEKLNAATEPSRFHMPTTSAAQRPLTGENKNEAAFTSKKLRRQSKRINRILLRLESAEKTDAQSIVAVSVAKLRFARISKVDAVLDDRDRLRHRDTFFDRDDPLTVRHGHKVIGPSR